MNSVRLTDVFVGLADRWKGRAAVVSPQLSLTYDELLIRAARSARELRASGVEPGARVAIALRDSGETVVLMIALWMLGATPVPVDFRSNATERGKLATEFDLLAVLEDRQAPAASHASMLVDASWGERIARHDADSTLAKWRMRTRADFLDVRHDVASGRVRSRSRPGAVQVNDGSPRSYGGCLLNPLSLSFSGSRSHTLSALLQGATVRFYPVLFSSEELAEAIVAWKVGSFCAVPTIIRALLELSERPSDSALPGTAGFLFHRCADARRGEACGRHGIVPELHSGLWVHGFRLHQLPLRLRPRGAARDGRPRPAVRSPASR